MTTDREQREQEYQAKMNTAQFALSSTAYAVKEDAKTLDALIDDCCENDEAALIDASISASMAIGLLESARAKIDRKLAAHMRSRRLSA